MYSIPFGLAGLGGSTGASGLIRGGSAGGGPSSSGGDDTEGLGGRGGIGNEFEVVGGAGGGVSESIVEETEAKGFRGIGTGAVVAKIIKISIINYTFT